MNFVKFASKKGSLVLHGMAKNSSAVLVLTLIFMKKSLWLCKDISRQGVLMLKPKKKHKKPTWLDWHLNGLDIEVFFYK